MPAAPDTLAASGLPTRAYATAFATMKSDLLRGCDDPWRLLHTRPAHIAALARGLEETRHRIVTCPDLSGD